MTELFQKMISPIPAQGNESKSKILQGQDFFYGNESIVNLKTGKKAAGKSEKILNEHRLH